MNVLVTGAFGNIGANTVRELKRNGHNVRCFDLDTQANRRQAKEMADLEVVWGDLTEPQDVATAVDGVDAVIHLAAIIPPMTDRNPELAERVNVGGTRNVVYAIKGQERPPKLVFTSSVAVYGNVHHKEPPRRVDEPVNPSDTYGAHKVRCEEIIRDSGIEWTILRLGAVPPVSLDNFDPLVFECALDGRVEFVHTKDVGLAAAHAVDSDEVWGKTLLIGGGPSCQTTYRDFLTRNFTAMGVGMLPDEAFREEPFYTDWFDTEESQRLLDYQRHDIDDYIRELQELLGWKRWFVGMVRPFVRRYMLSKSPYYKQVAS